MTRKPQNDHSKMPGAILLLPVAVTFHVAEEWFGGFTDWARVTMGVDIGAARFIAINLTGLIVFTVGAVSAYISPRSALIGVTLTSLVCLNAIVHTGLTLAYGVYSPGTATGLLLYAPLSAVIFRWAFANLPGTAIAGAVLAGFVLHALVTISATL